MPKIGKPKKPTPANIRCSAMPPLRHSFEDQPFAVLQSPVVQWMCQQPEIMQAMFEWYRSTGAIVFDPETRTWRGENS